MNLLQPIAGLPPHRPTIVLFGVGLIGGGIKRALCRGNQYTVTRSGFPWDQPPNEKLATLRQLTSLLSGQSSPVSIVWAAGRSGFAAGDSATAEELADFRRVVDFALNLRSEGHEVSFSMVSSAGGLFEGQRLIGRHSIPSPLRPYGRLKLSQEHALESIRDKVDVRIYRPSSVYGDIRTSVRLGLLSSLLMGCVRHQVTPIVGSLTTLRDYVHTEDIGGFLASELMSPVPCAANGPVLLASGRAYSILEILHTIHRITRHKPYIRIDSVLSNSGDMTFHASDLPPRPWNPVSVEIGLRAVYANWCLSGHQLSH